MVPMVLKTNLLPKQILIQQDRKTQSDTNLEGAEELTSTRVDGRMQQLHEAKKQHQGMNFWSFEFLP